MAIPLLFSQSAPSRQANFHSFFMQFGMGATPFSVKLTFDCAFLHSHVSRFHVDLTMNGPAMAIPLLVLVSAAVASGAISTALRAILHRALCFSVLPTSNPSSSVHMIVDSMLLWS
jgi:hypothetical protein